MTRGRHPYESWVGIRLMIGNQQRAASSRHMMRAFNPDAKQTHRHAPQNEPQRDGGHQSGGGGGPGEHHHAEHGHDADSAPVQRVVQPRFPEAGITPTMLAKLLVARMRPFSVAPAFSWRKALSGTAKRPPREADGDETGMA